MSDFFAFTPRDLQMLATMAFIFLFTVFMVSLMRYDEYRRDKEFEHRFRKNHR